MAPWILAIALVLSIPATAAAEDSTHDFVLLLSMAVIDYRQSADMFYEDGGYHEINQIMGERPSRADMIAFGATGIGLTYLLADALPDPWGRILIDSVIASEKMNIEENRRVHHGWNTEGPPLRGREMNAIPLVLSLRF